MSIWMFSQVLSDWFSTRRLQNQSLRSWSSHYKIFRLKSIDFSFFPLVIISLPFLMKVIRYIWIFIFIINMAMPKKSPAVVCSTLLIKFSLFFFVWRDQKRTLNLWDKTDLQHNIFVVYSRASPFPFLRPFYAMLQKEAKKGIQQLSFLLYLSTQRWALHACLFNGFQMIRFQ